MGHRHTQLIRTWAIGTHTQLIHTWATDTHTVNTHMGHSHTMWCCAHRPEHTQFIHELDLEQAILPSEVKQTAI